MLTASPFRSVLPFVDKAEYSEVNSPTCEFFCELIRERPLEDIGFIKVQ